MPKKNKLDAVKKDYQQKTGRLNHQKMHRARPKTNKSEDRHRVYPAKHRKNKLDRKAVNAAFKATKRKGARYLADKMDKQDRKDLKKLSSKRRQPTTVS